jgi:formylglycine-generating enzyme required for sulfatase activity
MRRVASALVATLLPATAFGQCDGLDILSGGERRCFRPGLGKLEWFKDCQANYNGEWTYGGGPVGEFRKKPLPVDSFEPNPWGLYQVHGNVADWVEDCRDESYQGAPADGSAWTTGDCIYKGRVLRGGRWVSQPQHVRSAFRGFNWPTYRNFNVGFRVGRAPNIQY